MNTGYIELLAMGMFFIYQIGVLKYAVQILVKGTQKLLTIYSVAIINCILATIYVILELPMSSLFVLIILILAIEFKLMSNAGWVQTLCGAVIFSMHIASTTILIQSIINWLIYNTNLSFANEFEHRAFVLYITCFTLYAFVQPFVERVFDSSQIQRVTTVPKYSVLLLCAILGLVFFETIHIIIILERSYFSTQLLLSVASSLFVIGTFYFLFTYGISLVNASFYKRKSDAVKEEKETIEEAKARLSRRIERDSLTGVFSRSYGLELLSDLTESEFLTFSILYVDINALKFTNDAYGHEAGDRLIVRIANALCESIREKDTVARLGGDEFIVIAECESSDVVKEILERIELNILKEDKEENFTVSASIGSIFVDNSLKARGVDYILSQADRIMRENKEKFYK